MDLTTKQLHTENRYHCLSAQFSLSRLSCTVVSTLQLNMKTLKLEEQICYLGNGAI